LIDDVTLCSTSQSLFLAILIDFAVVGIESMEYQADAGTASSEPDPVSPHDQLLQALQQRFARIEV
jgi:hypothetical protein